MISILVLACLVATVVAPPPPNISGLMSYASRMGGRSSGEAGSGSSGPLSLTLPSGGPGGMPRGLGSILNNANSGSGGPGALSGLGSAGMMEMSGMPGMPAMSRMGGETGGMSLGGGLGLGSGSGRMGGMGGMGGMSGMFGMMAASGSGRAAQVVKVQLLNLMTTNQCNRINTFQKMMMFRGNLGDDMLPLYHCRCGMQMGMFMCMSLSQNM